MIVSHKYKFIFLKTNKTAGTSIEIALSRFCGEDDIITRVSASDEALRKELGYRGAQNFVIPFSKYSPLDFLQSAVRAKRKTFLNHMQARVVRKYLEPHTWDGYYKFCFERNPWDRAVSHYHWHYRDTEHPPPFSGFLASRHLMTLKRHGYDLYTIDGELAVDHVYRFEDMDAALADIRERLGLPDALELPRTKVSRRADEGDYRVNYSDTDRDRVADLFADEIRLMGYTF